MLDSCRLMRVVIGRVAFHALSQTPSLRPRWSDLDSALTVGNERPVDIMHQGSISPVMWRRHFFSQTFKLNAVTTLARQLRRAHILQAPGVPFLCPWTLPPMVRKYCRVGDLPGRLLCSHFQALVLPPGIEIQMRSSVSQCLLILPPHFACIIISW